MICDAFDCNRQAEYRENDEKVWSWTGAHIERAKLEYFLVNTYSLFISLVISCVCALYWILPDVESDVDGTLLDFCNGYDGSAAGRDCSL